MSIRGGRFAGDAPNATMVSWRGRFGELCTELLRLRMRYPYVNRGK